MRWYSFVTMGILFFVTSCGSPAVTARVDSESTASESRVIYLRQEGQSATLSSYLKVVRELSKFDENGLFIGLVVFNNSRYRSKTSPNLVCDVQFVFFDESGLEIEKTNWQPVMFQAGVDVTVKQVAMNPNTRDYKVYVREPKTPGR